MPYQLVLDGAVSSDIPPFADLETAKKLGVEYLTIDSSRKVRIDNYPPATTPPTPMTAIRYDASSSTWTIHTLP